ncbi:hypothetical protein GCM10020219_092910 [Nonomuraea dietziae]
MLLDVGGHRLALLRVRVGLRTALRWAGAAHARTRTRTGSRHVIDALLPRLSQAGELETAALPVEISELAWRVGYCMHSDAYPSCAPSHEVPRPVRARARALLQEARLGRSAWHGRAGEPRDAGALARLRRRLARSLS